MIQKLVAHAQCEWLIKYLVNVVVDLFQDDRSSIQWDVMWIWKEYDWMDPCQLRCVLTIQMLIRLACLQRRMRALDPDTFSVHEQVVEDDDDVDNGISLTRSLLMVEVMVMMTLDPHY